MRVFDVEAFLDSAGIATTIVKHRRGEAIFSQGDAAVSVMCIQQGGVELSVRSTAGREAVVAMLGPGDFFGEGCLAGQPSRMGSARAVLPTAILVLKKAKMARLLNTQPELAGRFVTHVVAANLRIQEDLANQLFNHDEQRLARTLLLLARYGTQDKPRRVIPRPSRAALAKMAGTTASKVDFFLRKFTRLGFVDDDGQMRINDSLLSVVLHE